MRPSPPLTGRSARWRASSAPRRAYLRQLPAALAGINLQHGLLAHRGELIMRLSRDN
jgi:hypothetical protein